MQQTLDKLAPLALVAAFLLAWGGEQSALARQPLAVSPRRRRNLALTALNFLIGGAIAAAALAISTAVSARRWGLSALPGALPVLAGVLLLDLVDYGRHRLSHAWPLLWRLHRVHHSDREVDVTTALRSHPIEQALRVLFDGAAIAVAGITPLALALHARVQIATLFFAHANLRLPRALDRALAWVVPTPAVHLVHHSRRRDQTDSNFGAVLTSWDRLFGSFRAPVAAPLGLDGFDGERDQTLAGMLRCPWRAGT